MKYIGSFFRMNSLSTKEIESQLLHFARESIKHIVLESKCGVPISHKTLKKALSDSEYSKVKDLNTILAIYKKAKPNIYYSKHSKLWDESTFKKDILISSNALMTFNILKLASYYKSFKNIDDRLFDLSKIYIKIAKIQLDFYYNSLRNSEGFFIDKKNSSSSNTSFPDLSEINNNFKFSDQAYMMISYYLYSKSTDNPKESETFKSFALEILDMFEDRKDYLYDESLEEIGKICYAFNLMYDISKNMKCKSLLLDIADFLLSQHLDYGIDEKDMSVASITALNLYLAYNNTNILAFKDGFDNICKLFKSLYSEDLGTFVKATDKKDSKYYNTELTLYLINLILYNKKANDSEAKNNNSFICDYFKKSIISSNILTSCPGAPSLDSPEKYKHFSNKSQDLLDDGMFISQDAPTPESSCLASIFLKSTTYSKKKGEYSSSKTNFESYNNMFIDSIILNLFQDDYLKFISPIPKYKNSFKSDSRKIKPFRNSEDISVPIINEPKKIEKNAINNVNEDNIIDVQIIKDDLSTVDYEVLE